MYICRPLRSIYSIQIISFSFNINIFIIIIITIY